MLNNWATITRLQHKLLSRLNKLAIMVKTEMPIVIIFVLITFIIENK